VLPLFLGVLFLFFDLGMFFVERTVAQYAAFMAARSYQVYGRFPGTQGAPLFKEVGYEILLRALPMARNSLLGLSSGAVVKVDTEMSDIELGETSLEFPRYRTEMDFYLPPAGLPGHIAVEHRATENIAFGGCNETRRPRYGLLRVAYPFRSRSGLGNIFGVLAQGLWHEVRVTSPYRLERGVLGYGRFCGP